MKKWLQNHTGDILILLFVVIILGATIFSGICDRKREEQTRQQATAQINK